MKTFDAKNDVERLSALNDPRVILEDIREKIINKSISTEQAKKLINHWNKTYLSK